MSTGKEYLHFILDQFSDLDGVSYQQAFGEYMIYLNGRIAAYLCDDRLLVKPVPAALSLLPDAPHEPPYPGAKEMLVVEQVDDRHFLAALFTAMWPELPQMKKKANSKKHPDALLQESEEKRK